MEINEDFIKKHWFQLGILAIGLFVAWIAYSSLVIQPERARQEEVAQQEAARIAMEIKEKERQVNLEQCLAESKYGKTSSHLWMCSSLGRTSKSCGEVFGGASSVLEAFGNYETYFETNASVDTNIVEKFNAYTETCNCGLEKYRRDEFDQEKSEKDKLCLVKYGK